MAPQMRPGGFKQFKSGKNGTGCLALQPFAEVFDHGRYRRSVHPGRLAREDRGRRLADSASGNPEAKVLE